MPRRINTITTTFSSLRKKFKEAYDQEALVQLESAIVQYYRSKHTLKFLDIHTKNIDILTDAHFFPEYGIYLEAYIQYIESINTIYDIYKKTLKHPFILDDFFTQARMQIQQKHRESPNNSTLSCRLLLAELQIKSIVDEKNITQQLKACISNPQSHSKNHTAMKFVKAMQSSNMELKAPQDARARLNDIFAAIRKETKQMKGRKNCLISSKKTTKKEETIESLIKALEKNINTNPESSYTLLNELLDYITDASQGQLPKLNPKDSTALNLVRALNTNRNPIWQNKVTKSIEHLANNALLFGKKNKPNSPGPILPRLSS